MLPQQHQGANDVADGRAGAEGPGGPGQRDRAGRGRGARALVARANGVKARRVVTALVSRVVADVAADIRRGDLSADQVRWLVALATWRAEDQVTSVFPPTEFRPASLASP
jgi:hypothetical protein